MQERVMKGFETLLKHKINNQNFINHTNCWKNIRPSSTRSYYKTLAYLESFSVIGSELMTAQCQLIRGVLNAFANNMQAYCNDISSLHANKHNTPVTDEMLKYRKCTVARTLKELANSIIDFAVTSPLSLTLIEICQEMYGLHSDGFIYFVDEDKIPAGAKFAAGRFGGVGNDQFRAKNLFDVGVAKTPTAINHAWNEYISVMQDFLWLLQDETMSLYHGMQEKIDATFAWHKFFCETEMFFTTFDENNDHQKWLNQFNE